jgi:hypothetical protein
MTDDLLPRQIEILRRMTPAQRFERGLRFLRMTREWLAAGVRQRHPDWSADRVTAETRRLIDHARD